MSRVYHSTGDGAPERATIESLLTGVIVTRAEVVADIKSPDWGSLVLHLDSGPRVFIRGAGFEKECVFVERRPAEK